MTSFTVNSKQALAGTCRWLLLLLLLALLLLLCGPAAVFAQNAPSKGGTLIVTSQPAGKKSGGATKGAKVAPVKGTGSVKNAQLSGASGDDLATAKAAAISSINGGGSKSSPDKKGKRGGGHQAGKVGASKPSRGPVGKMGVGQSRPRPSSPGGVVIHRGRKPGGSRGAGKPSDGKRAIPTPEELEAAKPTPVEPVTTAPATTMPATTQPTTTAPADAKAPATIAWIIPEADPEAQTYIFNYDNTPWPDVLVDFGRMSGLSYLSLPIVKGNVTYRSPNPFTYKEAMHQLNELLLAKPLDKHLIRRHDKYLTVERIADAMREIESGKMFNSFVELDAAHLDAFDIAMVVFDVPEQWSPYEIIETFRHMFSDTYGTQVVGEKIELTGLVREHRRFHEVVSILTGSRAPEPPDSRPRHIIRLKHAKVAEVQTILKQLFPVSSPRKGSKRGGVGVDPKAQRAQSVTIVPNIKSNELYVRAPQSIMNEILQMAMSLDAAGGEYRPPVMKVIKLTHAAAASVTQVLKPIIAKQNSEMLKARVWVDPIEVAALTRDIFPDIAGNSIIIVGGEKGIASAEELIKQYDVPDDSQVTEIIEVHVAKAADIVGLLQAAMPPPGKGQRAPQVMVRTSNTLLVTCPRPELERIKGLVAKLDVKSDDDAKEHFVELQEMKPSEMATLLQQIFSGTSSSKVPARPSKSRKGGRRPSPRPVAGGSGPQFIADDAGNLLIVMCVDEDWERVISLIHKLDVEAQEPVLRKFALERADASDVAAHLQQMFPMPPTPKGAIPVRQFISADTFNNTVNIFAKVEFIERISPFIEQLDIHAESPLTVIRLEHADAETIAPILVQTFGGKGRSAPRRPTPRGKGGKPRPAPRASAASGGKVSIIPEPITNSLFIKAPAKELAQIQDLIAQMEEKAADGIIEPVVVTVQHRPADEVTAVLQSLLGGGSARGPGRKGKAPTAAATGALKIVPSGKRIILSGSRDEIVKAIQLLDVIDVVEQQPILKKYAVEDAEEAAAAINTMLASGAAPRARPKGGKGGKRPPASSRGVSGIKVLPNIYESTVLVRAMPEDILRVDEIVKMIHEEPMTIEGMEPIEPLSDFFTIKLRYKKAFDISYTIESLLNPPGSKGGPILEEGPTERTLLVSRCKNPATREKVEKLVAMWDVPEGIGHYRDDMIVIDPKTMPAAQLILRLQKNYVGPQGEGIKILDPGGSGGRIKVIDIHEGEDDPEVSQPATPSAMSPGTLPAFVMQGLSAMAMGQQVQANQPHESVDPMLPTVSCQLAYHNAGVFPEQILAALDVALGVTLEDDPDDPPAETEEADKEADKADEPVVEESPVDSTPLADSTPLVVATEDEVENSLTLDEQGEAVKDVILMEDPVTGKIIATGSEEQLELLRTLAEEFDGDKAPTVYRMFPLKYTDVAEAAQLLGQVFNQPTRRAPKPRPQPKGGKKGAPGGQKAQPGQKGGRPPRAPAPTPARIKVIPNPRTRSLFVVAALPDIPLIVEVLRYIDVPLKHSEGSLKIFKLQNLDASQVVQNLREVLGLSSSSRRPPRARPGRQTPQQQQQQQQLQMQGKQGASAVVSSDNTRLTADSQTNSIIAQGSPDTLALVGKLIEELERETNTSKVEMKRVQLKHARATEVASIVKDVAGQMASGASASGRSGRRGGPRGGSSRVSVNADARTNSVILAGQVKDIERIEGIVKELDVDDEGSGSIRQFAVKGDCKQMEGVLKSLFVARGKGASDVVITANQASGMILVKAPAPLMVEIEKQILAMDEKVEAEQARRPIKLNLADATSVAPKLQDLFGEAAKGRGRGAKGSVTIKGNKSNNTLYVQCPDDLFDEIQQVAMDMDKQPEGLQVKSFQLEHASALAVQKQLETLMAQAARTKGMGDVKLDLVGVLPDARTNRLIVSGGPLTFLLIEQVLKQVDVEPDTPVKIETQTYQLPQAVVARDIARNIGELFKNENPRTTGVEKPVVTFNAAGNLVTVKANRTQHEEILKNIIEPVQQAVGESMQAYQIELQFASADEIKPVLEEFMNKWRTTRGNKPQDACTITADPNSNLLLVNCSPSTRLVIGKQLEVMDTEAAALSGSRTLKTYGLKFASIWAVRDAITQTFRRSGRVPQRDQVAVSLDGNTNSVSVLANDKNHEQIAEIVANMDVAPGEGSRRDYLYKVEHARAVDLANTLNNIIRSTRRATQGKYPVSVFGDDATNMLIINGPQMEYDSLMETVLALDVEGGGGRLTKIFTTKYAEPWHLPNIINQQFRNRTSRNPNDQVTASFINGTMSIVVSANPQNMEKVAELIAEVDVPSAAQKVTKYIKLKNARADSLANMLNTAVRNSEPRPRNGVYSVTYSAEMNSNTLVVSAAADRFEEIEATITELDVVDDSGRLTKTFTTKFAEPWHLPNIINQQFRNRTSRNPNDQVTASFINGTMTIVVSANPQNMEKVAELIAEVDVPSAAQKVTKYFKLENARADALANLLNTAIRNSEPRPRSGIYSIVYGSEMNTNMLIVSAPEEKFEEIEARIAELDKEDTGRITRTFQCAYVHSWRMADIINRQFRSGSRNPNDQVLANFEEGTQSIIVTANERNMERVAELIEMADKPPATKETRFMQLKFARADEAARTLNEAFRAKSVRNRQGQYPVTITADVASNNIIVTAKGDLFPEIEEMVASIDVEQPGEKIRKIFKLTFADPGSVSHAIRESFRQFGRAASPRDEVRTADDWTTNSVIITASAEKMVEIEALITEMDKPGDQLRTQHIIEVANTNAADVARSLQQIFDAANRGKRSRSGAVAVRAIEGTTKIAVLANAEEWAEVQKLVEQIDVQGGRSVHAVTMPELVSAKSVSDNINQIYGGGRGRSDGIRAECHEPTNTLLVFCTEAEFEKVNTQVISVLSQQPAIGDLKIFKVPLKFAVADEVARTLQDFFDKKSGKGGRGSRPWWADGGVAQQMENQVTIIAEPASNMLILYCTDKTKAMIDDLLVSIDTDEPIGGAKIMEMVSLKHMDAADMLGILTEYLKVSKRTKEDTSSNRPWWDRGRGGSKDDEKTVLAGDMRLKAVESSNSIIVVGRPDSVKDVLAKIEELDVEDIDGASVPKQIKLAHANATELADTLMRIFSETGQGGRGGRSGSAGGPMIVPVEATNTLLVKAKPSIFNQIRNMAMSLDSEMVGGGGVQLLRVPVGRDVENLAQLIEEQINDAEENKKKQNRDYRPSLVSIRADTTASTLLVSGSKAQYDEVERLVNELVAMGPAGGTSRRVIKLKNLSPEKAKQLIEQLREGSSGSSSKSGRRSGGRRGGRRGDATWTQDRRYETMEQQGKGYRTTCPTALPLIFAEATFGVVTAQSTPSSDKTDKSDKADDSKARRSAKPIISTIRPRKTPPKRPTTQPAMQPTGRQPASKPASKPARKPASKPASRRPVKTPEERIHEAAAPGQINWTDSAKNAIQRKLTGAPIEVVEGSTDSIIIDANDEDMEVILSIIEMLDSAIPVKKIEYIRLKNSRAKDLAKVLADVFTKIEKVGDKPTTPEDKVDIIADSRTNGIYIAATEEKMAMALELIRQNEDAETAEKNVRTFTFKNRRVSEAGEVLKKMIAAYLKQKDLPVDSIGVEFDPFQNAVLITGGEADLKVVEQIFKGLDAELPETKEGETSPMGEANLMIIPLRIAQADTLGTLLNELLEKAATGDTPMQDFIRRMRLLDEDGNPIAQIDLNRPIAVFGDPDSNALVIASTKENCLIMKQVAKAFDVEPAKSPVVHRVMTLKYADATEVAEQLDQLLSDSESLTERPGKSDKGGVPEGQAGSLVFKAVVKPDPRTNQIVIIGRPEAVPIMEELIAALDVKGLDPMPIEIIKLEEASATALEMFLTDMMEKRAEAIPVGTGPNADKFEKVIIKADPRTESLIVAARAARMEELRSLIKSLDVRASALIDDIRTITLHTGNAIDLADKLKDLWEQRKSQRGSSNEGLQLETPAIVADERSNSLIVAASKGDFDAIKAVVDKIEALELNPMANIYLVRLQFNSAQQLASAFTALFQKRAEMRTIEGKARPEDEVAIEVDEVTNSLIVVCSRENYEILMRKVQELDREMGVPGQIEFFLCDNVGAYRIKDTIEQLFQDGVFKPGATGDSQTAQDREKVSISIDGRANMLIVSASPENMDLIREVYKRMNSVKTPWDVAISRLITIVHGDSVKIAAQVQEYFDKLKDIRDTGESGSGKSGFEITIFADERSNRVIIGGTKDGIDSAVEMVRRLDVEPGRPGQITEVYTLTEAPASKIGEMIDNIFQERNTARSGATGPNVEPIKVTVETNESSNSLLVNASREDHILIADLVQRLDRPSTLLQRVRLFQLERAPAAKIKEVLDELYQANQGSGSSSGQNIVVVADERVNAVIVAAPPGELENIAPLLARLDDANIKGTFEVGVFACDNEDAEKMAELLNGIMTGNMEGSGSQEQEELRKIASTLISFRSTDDEGAKMLHEMVRENVQITHNVRTNSVVVVAPPSSLKLIGALVGKLDRIQKRPVLVKVFHLINSDAATMVDTLEKMFAIEGASQDQEEFQEGREILVEGGLSSTGALPTASSQEGPTRRGTFGRPKTTFVADERTNSILAAGWPEDIDVVADIVDQLDSMRIKDRTNTVYTLINSKAEDVQAALDSYFQAEKSVLDSVSGDSLSPMRRMEREVTVVAHEESNQLVISSSPRYQAQVLSIVEQLDIPPPQVMIHVMIAEVTLDDRFEMGLEFALQELRFSETAVPGGNGVLQSSHFDVIGGTDLGAAGAGLGGISFTVTGEDFNFLVRALQSDSRLEVIQSPSIMCQDNQEANITIGENVPFLRGTQVSDSGQVNSQVDYEKVGIILDVEPHINPDGFVYLKVKPEISGISDSSIDLGNGTRAPVFTERSAETTVAVKDGETVVIGGLITTTEREAESKVPFLGDIPGLGVLFRTTIRTKVRTELLIALTPRIVRTVEDGRRMSEECRDMSGIITDNMKQSLLFRGLQIEPETWDELDDIDAPPENGEMIEPDGATPGETQPRTKPHRGKKDPSEKDPSEKKYGPTAPKYGPQVPSDDEVLARRDRRGSFTAIGSRRR